MCPQKYVISITEDRPEMCNHFKCPLWWALGAMNFRSVLDLCLLFQTLCASRKVRSWPQPLTSNFDLDLWSWPLTLIFDPKLWHINTKCDIKTQFITVWPGPLIYYYDRHYYCLTTVWHHVWHRVSNSGKPGSIFEILLIAEGELKCGHSYLKAREILLKAKLK